MIAISVFFISVILLGAFLAVRLFEEKRGARFFASSRAHADERTLHLYRGLVMGSLPTEYRAKLFAAMQKTAHEAVLKTVFFLRALERPLTQLSYRLRHPAQGQPRREVSSFLKTLMPHPFKKKGEEGKSAEPTDSL